MTSTDFAGLGLPEIIVTRLKESGFETPTPIQAKAIPAQLEGRDILGIAQTGSGKTAAFSLPILAGLLEMRGKPAPKSARALILVPTRELAVQIDDMIRLYSPGRRFSTALILGGVSRHAQIQKLARGVDVAIATPGRLHDLWKDRKLRLDETRWLVLDEADRMLDMGFIAQVREVARAIGENRQTSLFSATMAPEIGKLAEGLLKEPVRVEAAPQGSTVQKIEQSVIMVPTRQKRDQLNALLQDESLSRVVIFSRTKYGADRVAKNLEADGHRAAAIHGNKSQNARQAALGGFRNGKVRILVATDIVARGIDVPNISHVINYELPDDAENYVHRIGRTGRNGASGIAITLVDGGERGKLRQVERLIRKTLPVTGELPKGGEGRAERGERGERGEGQGAPRRNRSGRPGQQNNRNHTGGGKKERGGNRPAQPKREAWSAMLDADVPQSERPQEDQARKPKQAKPMKGKKPRWNKRKKDGARVTKDAGNRQRTRNTAVA